jgi:hypothetical protein
MVLFETHYGAGRTSIVLKADLIHGLLPKDGKMKFVGQGYLPYKDETKFRCQLHVTFDTHEQERLVNALKTCANSWSKPNGVFVFENGKLMIECPIGAQDFKPSSLQSSNPVSFYSESANRLTTNKEVLDRLMRGIEISWPPATSSTGLQSTDQVPCLSRIEGSTLKTRV